MMKKTLLAMALAMATVISYADTITLKMSYVTQTASPKGAGAEKFKELAEKYTDGSVRVELYPSGSLYNDRDEMKALKENKVQMLAPAFTKMSTFYKTTAENPWLVLDMPFLFSSLDDVGSLEKAGIYDEMNATLKEQYAFVFGIWDNGLTQLSTREAITTWDDITHLKIRIQPSEISKEAIRSWGAEPRVLVYNELGIGTLYGAVDASTNPPSNMYGSKLMSMQKYMYKINNSYLGYAVLMNRKFWDSLNPGQRDALTRAIKETRDVQVNAADRENTLSIERILNTGLTRVVDIDPAILSRMKRQSTKVVSALSPLQKTYYDKIRAIIAKNSKASPVVKASTYVVAPVVLAPVIAVPVVSPVIAAPVVSPIIAAPVVAAAAAAIVLSKTVPAPKVATVAVVPAKAASAAMAPAKAASAAMAPAKAASAAMAPVSSSLVKNSVTAPVISAPMIPASKAK